MYVHRNHFGIKTYIMHGNYCVIIYLFSLANELRKLYSLFPSNTYFVHVLAYRTCSLWTSSSAVMGTVFSVQATSLTPP